MPKGRLPNFWQRLPRLLRHLEAGTASPEDQKYIVAIVSRHLVPIIVDMAAGAMKRTQSGNAGKSRRVAERDKKLLARLKYLSEDQIADEDDAELDTVRKRIQRAKKRLKK
jgi:hypothetical protein